MFKNTHIETLGNDYTITNQDGTTLAVIQVLTQSDILEAAIGKFDPEVDTFTSYLQKSSEVLTGVEFVDPNRVLWHATPDDEIVISDLIEYAVFNGYDKIVLEHLYENDDAIAI
jgi:hypothetical protein